MSLALNNWAQNLNPIHMLVSTRYADRSVQAVITIVFFFAKKLLKRNFYPFREITVKLFCIPSEKGPSIKGKNLLPTRERILSF